MKPVDLSPLNGAFDARSLPEHLGQNFRWVQNFPMDEKGKRSRRLGWGRFWPQREEDEANGFAYNNQDLHDQLLALQYYYERKRSSGEEAENVSDYPNADLCETTLQVRSAGRQPITMLVEAESVEGIRKLLAGTQKRLYVFNEATGNWKIISDEKGGEEESGCPERRFQSAQVLNTVVFTNNYTIPFYWIFDQPVFGCSMQSVSAIEDLDNIGLTKAGVVTSWKGVTLFGDVEMDGFRLNNRVVWSDYNDPLSWSPGAASIAGFQDLDQGEKILAMADLGDHLMIYTDLNVWQVSVVGGAEVFNFRKAYAGGIAGKGALAFRNTLISDGGTHRYLANDGVYTFTPFQSAPQREEWIDLVRPEIIETINWDCCENHVAGYNPITDEMWISWVHRDDTDCCPSRTIVINFRQGSVDYVDHGFTAFVHFTSDPRQNVRDWMLQNCICSKEELDEAGIKFFKEGLLRLDDQPACDNPPNSIHRTNDISAGGVSVEDYTNLTSSVDSLCDKLGDATIQDLCGECQVESIFVMASAQDYCLKEYGVGYYHERCTNPESTGSMADDGFSYTASVGEYAQDPYTSILRSGPLGFEWYQGYKRIHDFLLELQITPDPNPPEIKVLIGHSAQANDPNEENCPIIWNTQKAKKLACRSARTESEHKEAHTRPNQQFVWPLFYENFYIYYEIRIEGTGGSASIARATLNMTKSNRIEL